MNPRWSAVEVVVVGSLNVDQVTSCARFPEDGETVVADGYAQAFGGKGANQAVMAARLGARVAMIGCVGTDQLGAAAVENLVAHGVDVSTVARVDERPTGVAPIWVDGAGTNRILVVPGANAALDAAHVAAALVGRTASAVVAQLETPLVATAAAFSWARRSGAVTVLNVAPASPVSPDVLASTDWVIANETEFALLHGSAVTPATAAAAAAGWSCGVVVTLGATGAMLAEPGGRTTRVAAPAVVAVDTTGAGDAFVGTFAVALAAGVAPTEAARLGCVAGAHAVTATGTHASFPTADEVR